MKNKYLLRFLKLCIATALASCSDFIEIDAPRTDLTRENVFTSDEKATAALIDIYIVLHQAGFASGDRNSVSFLTALSSDDALNRVTVTPSYQQFNDNALTAKTEGVLSLWSDAYKIIYRCNSLIEGLAGSRGITEDVSAHLRAEALFIRSFCFFYLINLFGDSPIVLTTDYKINQNIPRHAQSAVYDQIVSDLKACVDALPNDYTQFNNNRQRATQAAARTLLARTYLFLGQWENAEAQASLVVSNHAVYSIVSLQDAFTKDNGESILALHPRSGNPLDRSVARTACYLRQELLDSFEENDQRKIVWVSGNVANKYRGLNGADNSVVLRLAEVYLIRAEARAQLNKLDEAREDLDVIRTRAGLPPTTATTQEEIIDAIIHEKRVEYFLEWGHRWLDLKRHGRATESLAPIKPAWQATDLLYPIPEVQIANNPSMNNSQNPGY